MDECNHALGGTSNSDVILADQMNKGLRWIRRGSSTNDKGSQHCGSTNHTRLS